MKFVYAILASVVLATQPNPPTWDTERVFVIEAGDSSAQALIDAALATNGGHDPADNGQWSTERYAFLFKPGDHSSLNMEVGYYTTVHGLGRAPYNTILGNLMVQNGDFNYQVGALNNFWRGAENVMVTPAAGTPMLWAVSQAAPLRRIQVNGDLQLFQYNYGCCAGFASGGFMADMLVTGKVTPGSQQQWMTRNAQVGSADATVWNGVYSGVVGSPSDHCSNSEGAPNTVVNYSPLVLEKPYIVYEDRHDGGKYYLIKPKAEWNKRSYTSGWQNVQDIIGFENVYVAKQGDHADLLNSKLSEGLHLVLQPGIYILQDSLKITQNGQVILGMGLATLHPINGTPAIEVGNFTDVRIAGVLLEAGETNSTTLLKMGEAGFAGDRDHPNSISDVYARVGQFYQNYPQQCSVDTMIQVNSGYTVIDNIWLWRADHDIFGLVKDGQNPSQTGLEVNGDEVMGYSLACEHTLADMLVWNGEGGATIFYQSEFPYDVTQANYGDKGYAAYKVGPNVQDHKGFGIGGYTYFRDNDVTVNSAIIAPSNSDIHFRNSLSVFLDGYGGVSHVINDLGDASVSGQTPNYWCEFHGSQDTSDEFLQ